MAAMVAEDEEFPLEGHGVVDMVGAGDEYLFHFRFYGQGGGADTFGVDRDLSPGEDLQTEFFSRPMEDVAAFLPESDLTGEEDRSHPVLSEGRQVDTEFQAFLEEEFVGRLYEDARSVARVVFATAGASVLHVFEDGECIRDDLMVLVSFQVGHKADTTGVMLEFGTV